MSDGGFLGQVHAQLIEDLLELGHDDQNQKRRDTQDENKGDDRIGHRRLDFPPKLLRGLHVIGQAVENGVNLTGSFTRPDHVDIDAAENLSVLVKGGGKVAAGTDSLDDIVNDKFEPGVGDLFLEDLKGLQERDAGGNHGGKLPREDAELLQFHAGAGFPTKKPLRHLLFGAHFRRRGFIGHAGSMVLPGRDGVNG